MFSFGSDISINFTKNSVEKEVLIEKESLYIMSGESRYKWKHEIKQRKYDNGIPRKRRISVTFRKIV